MKPLTDRNDEESRLNYRHKCGVCHDGMCLCSFSMAQESVQNLVATYKVVLFSRIRMNSLF